MPLFPYQGSAGANQPPAPTGAKRQTTVTKSKGATGSGKSQKKTKGQNQSASKTLKVSMPAIKGKKEGKMIKQTAQNSSEDDSEGCRETTPVLEIDPQTQLLPADLSDDEDLTGSVDREKVTESVPTDTQRYKDDIESEDDIEITHIAP